MAGRRRRRRNTTEWFVKSFVVGACGALHVAWLLSAPLLVADEMQRMKETEVVATVLVWALAAIKFVYGMVQLSLAFNPLLGHQLKRESASFAEVVKLVLTCVVFDGLAKHSDVSGSLTLGQVYKGSGQLMSQLAHAEQANSAAAQLVNWCLVLGCLSALCYHSGVPALRPLSRLVFVCFAAVRAIGTLCFAPFARPLLLVYPDPSASGPAFARLGLCASALAIGSALALYWSFARQGRGHSLRLLCALLASLSLLPDVLHQVSSMRDCLLYDSIVRSGIAAASGSLESSQWQQQRVLYPPAMQFSLLMRTLLAASAPAAMAAHCLDADDDHDDHWPAAASVAAHHKDD